MSKRAAETETKGIVREPYLSTAQASKMLGVSERWLTVHKEIPRHKVGHFVKFLERDIHDHFQKQ
jgi:hypothetical protein